MFDVHVHIGSFFLLVFLFLLPFCHHDHHGSVLEVWDNHRTSVPTLYIYDIDSIQ